MFKKIISRTLKPSKPEGKIMMGTIFKAAKNPTIFFSTIVLTASTSWALSLSMVLGSAGLMMGVPSSASAQSTTKPVLSCWATKAGRNYVRVSWTPANADNADRYTVKRSRDGGNDQWMRTESKHARSSIVTESSSGNLQYLVETISASGTKVSRQCGPNGGLDHNGTSSPVAVAACWATKRDDGTVRITWTPRPNDGANRYTVMKSKNRGDYQWVDTVSVNKKESIIALDSAGTFRFQVRTVAKNSGFVVRDCGPNTGVTGLTVVNAKITVMPIGDSITLGATHRPAYRYPMQDANKPGKNQYIGCGINLVGSASKNWRDDDNPPTYRAPPSGTYAGFDHDHASWGGNTVRNLLKGVSGGDFQHVPVKEHVKKHQPDVVLLHIGTNDILKGVSLENSKVDLRALIDDIKLASPKTLIFVAKIIRPGNSQFKERVDTWNSFVGDVVNATGSRTRLVDMDAIWPRYTNPLGGQVNLTQTQIDENQRFFALTLFNTPKNDGVHPSIEGAMVLADQWLKEMKNAQVCSK